MSDKELTVASALPKTVVCIAEIIQGVINFVFKIVGIRDLTVQRFCMQKFHWDFVLSYFVFLIPKSR